MADQASEIDLRASCMGKAEATARKATEVMIAVAAPGNDVNYRQAMRLVDDMIGDALKTKGDLMAAGKAAGVESFD